PKDDYEKLPPPPPPAAIIPDQLPPVEEQQQVPDTSFVNQPVTAKEGTFYRVQVFASHNELLTAEHIQSNLRLSMPVTREVSGEWIRFTVGEFTSMAKAIQLIKQLRGKGVRGAFVVKFVNGERIP
ncbi:MAG: SPOR domain-containing protein, partial [bacterium]